LSAFSTFTQRNTNQEKCKLPTIEFCFIQKTKRKEKKNKQRNLPTASVASNLEKNEELSCPAAMAEEGEGPTGGGSEKT
jgi:hypothetical protein